MNKTEPITPLQNSEDYEKLKTKYEAEIQAHKNEIEKWKNTAIKSDEECLEKNRLIERLEQDKDALKRENHRQRRIELDQKETKQSNEFLATLAQRLDAKLGGAK